jgi:DNA-binding protein H-NS
MTKDLTNMTYEELLEHRMETEAHLEKQKEEALNQLVTDIKNQIENSRFTSKEVLSKLDPKSVSTSRRRKTTVKYVHPEDPSLTWSGRGPNAPKWVREYLGIEKLDRSNPEHVIKLEKLETKG